MKIKWFSLVRLTGLLLVLLYHFFQTTFPGGFIGVDVFFTFSGYLVTALFIDEYSRTRRIDWLGFARRRLYRIVPPVVLMILLVMPLTVLVKRDFTANISQQILATLGFTTNIYEQLTGGNYESQFIPHLFLHTWSLAIEVQFYVFWGLMVTILSKCKLSSSRFRGLLFLLSAGLFILSFSSLFIRTLLNEEFSQLYFSSFGRSFSFFLGSLFASQAGVELTTKRFKKNVKRWSPVRTLTYAMGSLFLLLLLAFLLEFNHQVTYLFGFVLTSLFSALLIYTTRILHERTPGLEEPLWLNYLSAISYGIYLWHWPFYIIFSQLMPQLVAVTVTMTLSVFLASLSHQVIEPWVAGKPGQWFGRIIGLPTKRLPLYGLLGTLIAITLGITLTAPKMGEFEENLLISSLMQAGTNIYRTHQLTAGDATAINDVLIIGDSVTLRASQSIATSLNSAQVDATVSRSFADAYDIFQNHIKNQTLAKTVVIAVGVNSVYNYQTDIEQFVTALPTGHRLVLVTPYNIKDGRVPAVRDYELALAQQHDFVSVADWYKAAQDNPTIWEGTDGVHFSDRDSQGADLYAETIKRAVREVAKKPAKP